MTSFADCHVALIDSGIGGFSVLAEIERKLPEVSISYFMDNRYLPYGELEEPLLLERLQCIVDFLLSSRAPDLIVLACNTASTQSLDFLRQRFGQIFVGVVPAVKPAAKLTRSGVLGVLATPATVNGQYIETLIGQFAADCVVHKVGSSELVHLAEQHFWQEDEASIDGLSFPVLSEVDTLVLGCTHFPLIKADIQRMLPEGIELVDSGSAIANRVLSLFESGVSEGKGGAGKYLYASDELSTHRKGILSQMGFDSISHVGI